MEKEDNSNIDYKHVKRTSNMPPTSKQVGVNGKAASCTPQTSSQPLTQTPTHKLLKIALLLLAIFSVLSGYSLISPFFPEQAKKKGLSETEIGTIFAFFPAVVFFMAPVYGTMVCIQHTLTDFYNIPVNFMIYLYIL